VLSRLDDRSAWIADVDDEVPDLEQDRSVPGELDGDEETRDVDQERLRGTYEAREVVVTRKRSSVRAEREDGVDVPDQRPVGLRDRRELELIASQDGEAAETRC
jgi:hypothetical protein